MPYAYIASPTNRRFVAGSHHPQGLGQFFWYCFRYCTLTLPPRQIDDSKSDLMFLYTRLYSKYFVQLFWYYIRYHTLALLHRQFNDSKTGLMTLLTQFHSQWMGHLFGIVFGAVRWHYLPDKSTIRCMSHDFVYAVSLTRLCSTLLYCFQCRKLTYNQRVTVEISGTHIGESGHGEFYTQGIYWRQEGQRKLANNLYNEFV